MSVIRFPDLLSLHRDDIPEGTPEEEWDDHTVRTRTDYKLLIAMEHHFELASGLAAMAMPSASHMAYLAWAGRRDNGEKLDEFEEWADGLVAVSEAPKPRLAEEREGRAGPTDPA